MGNKPVKVTDSDGRLSQHSPHVEYSSSSEGSTSISIRSNSVHGNLMRSIRRDPLKIYEVVKMLGEGSMASKRLTVRNTAAAS